MTFYIWRTSNKTVKDIEGVIFHGVDAYGDEICTIKINTLEDLQKIYDSDSIGFNIIFKKETKCLAISDEVPEDEWEEYDVKVDGSLAIRDINSFEE